MGQTTGQIEHQIEQQREDISQDVQKLENTVRSRVDDVRHRLNVREYVDQHPREALGLAIAAGIALASMVYHPDGQTHDAKPPQRRELNETLSLTREALMQVGKKELNSLKSSVTGKGQSQQSTA